MLPWVQGVADKYMLSREVTAVTFHLLDRYIALEVSSHDYSETPITEEDFQLYVMACLYITIKATVPYRKLTPSCIMEMTGGYFSEDHVEEAELDILTALEWHLHPPTIVEYCHLYIQLFPTGIEAEKMLRYGRSLSPLLLKDTFFIGCPASLCALATILMAAQRYGSTYQEVKYFLNSLQGLVDVQSEDFDSILDRVESLC